MPHRVRDPLRRRRRAIRHLVAVGVLAASLLKGEGVAVAAPPTSAAVPTVQIDGAAFAQVVIGRTVYVGGTFTTARPAGAKPGTHEHRRRNLLAYDLHTGRLTSWAPRTNGVVRALAASADGKTIYAVGTFTIVSGHTRSRIVAIGTGGGVRAAFHPSLNSPAFAVAVHGSTVYVGGQFTVANGRTRSRAAAFDRTSGAIRAWRPRVDSTVLALVVSKTGRSVVLGGRFGVVNRRAAAGTARVGGTVGLTNLPWRLNTVVGNRGANAAVYSLSSSGGFVYGTGYSYGSSVRHRLEGAFVASWSTGAVHWIEDCHGDSYSVARSGDTVYVAGHAHDCRNIGGFRQTDPVTYHRALAFTQAVEGVVAKNRVAPYSSFGGEPAPTLLDWRPDFDTGTITGQDQGPWSVVTASGWVLFAGEFRHVDGIAQQGLARFEQ